MVKLPVTKDFDRKKVIGEIKIRDCAVKLINSNSVFSIAYTEKKGGELKELLEISLITDDNYEKYLKRIKN